MKKLERALILLELFFKRDTFVDNKLSNWNSHDIIYIVKTFLIIIKNDLI